MKNKIILDQTVYISKDYDKFTFLDANRKLNKANLKKLMNSMKEEQLIIPIIVNEKLQIIDGQHRFTSEKELQLPVYYIVINGYGLDQVKRANTVGVNWTKEDFLQTYIKEENENYIALEELKKDHGLQIGTILKLFSAFNNQTDEFINRKFKEGEFEVGEHLTGIRYFCSQLELFSTYKDYKANSFILAFLKLYLNDDFDLRQMEKQAKWIGQFEPKGRSQEYLLEELCKQVYSYRLNKQENQLYYSRELKRFFK